MKFFLTTLLLSSTSTFSAPAQIKVIYGEDNRVDPIDSVSQKYVTLSKSTAAMIKSKDLKELNASQVIIGGKTLEDSGVCSTERFSSQPAMANCSGFLVGNDKLVTAGHCIRSMSDCSSNSWVFDYKVDHVQDSKVVVDKSNVYKCKSIISRDLDRVTQSDYALIELEKVVVDRKPLKFRSEGQPSVGDALVVIGHPSGLPTKIADGASVRSVGDVFLLANLDTYGGNSGSAVFNANTGLVEGILVRGETDYVWSNGCRVSNTLSNSSGDGEAVTLIKMVEKLEVVPEEDLDDGSDDSDVSEPSTPVEEPKQETAWERFLRWLRGA